MAATTAEPRLSRRSLERTGMTPEQELALLIQEQREDDSPFVDTPSWQISLDAPIAASDGSRSTVGAELVGYDPWDLVDGGIDIGLETAELAYSGDLVCHLHPRRGEVLTDPRKIPHGTRGAYNNHGCRCAKCRAANTAYRRELRATRRTA